MRRIAFDLTWFISVGIAIFTKYPIEQRLDLRGVVGRQAANLGAIDEKGTRRHGRTIADGSVGHRNKAFLDPQEIVQRGPGY
jgi:hypothetical protein